MIGGSRRSLVLEPVGVDCEPPVRIYLDANANAPVARAVRSAILRALDDGANPSSAHAGGEYARVMLTAARDSVASLCEGLLPEDVVFTSGCTEANNLIVATAKARGATFITSAVEHPSILRPAEALATAGAAVVFLPVEANGRVRLDHLKAELAAAPGPAVVSIQAANSETGVVQPLDEIAACVANHADALFHSDAAQAFGRLPLRVGVGPSPDVLSVSAHKIHGPMGVGALLMREGEDRLIPLLLGGDQERGLRAGTEPLPLIAGFGAACDIRRASFESDVARMSALRNQLETAICDALPGVIVNGADAPRLPNTSNVQFPGIDGMVLLARLDADGVLASQGSACHSRRPEPSHVLRAMGLSEAQAFSSIRFSVSPLNNEREIDDAVDLIIASCRQLGLGA